ncbi:MAG: hypothetical protein ABDH32_01985 [Candidatus Caldarchaeales archaeon]
MSISIHLVESQVEDQSVMVGFTNSYLFPLLDGGMLYFEKGENLWVMAIEDDAKVSLISPTKDTETFSLEPLQPTLIKKFSKDDQVGEWILQSGKNNLTVILSEEVESPEIVRLNYRIKNEELIVELANRTQSSFIIDVEDGDILIPAGVEVEIEIEDLNLTEGKYYGEVVMDLVYPEEFTYSGKLDGRPYLISMESTAGRIIGKIDKEFMRLSIPGLHTVGAGGIIPVRKGEALLKVRYTSIDRVDGIEEDEVTTPNLGDLKIHVVDDSFIEWAGKKASKSITLNVREALNKTLRVISSFEDKLELSYSMIPLSSMIFYEPRLNKIVGNISVIANGYQVEVVDNIVYVLLSDSESTLSIPVTRSSREILVRAYVNQFRAYEGRVNIGLGEQKIIPVKLYHLQIQAFFPNNTQVLYGELKMNGSRLNYYNGTATMLIPPGTYKIEFTIDEWYGNADLKVSEDASIKITLVRGFTILDYLRIVAIIEVAIIVFFIILMIRFRKSTQYGGLKEIH